MSAGNQGGPDGFDDNNIEEIGNPQFLPADHPLYVKLQQAFEKQLSDEYERVHLEYLDKANTLRAMEKEKEDVGVQLYGLQQQLADMQLAFESSHENYNNTFKRREENESKLASLGENLEFRRSEIEDLKKKVDRASEELSKLNANLNYMKEHNVDLKSELKLTQRTTHRTEENITQVEKEKKAQDFLIDQMNEEIKRLTEQISILESQTIAQKKQTEEAVKILNDADIEMNKIRTSKKNLMEHWNKAIFEIQEKDKNLQKMKDTLIIDEEENIKITSEISGVEKEIREQNEQQSVLGDKKASLENIMRHYKIKNEQLVEQQKKIDARNMLLLQSLQSTQEEMRLRDLEVKRLQDEIEFIEKDIMKLHTETRKKEDAIVTKISVHKTVSKETISDRKMINKLFSEIEDKEMEYARHDNELARIDIDILNTKNQIEQLEERNKEVEEEKQGFLETVSEYDKKIKSNLELHEKQMHDVAKYNRELEKAMQRQNVFSKGPSDAKLINIKKETADVKEETRKKQGEFIKEQTLQVKREETYNELQEAIRELKSKEIILEQKRIRLNTQYEQHNKEIKIIQTNLKNYENDMRKLNERLASNYETAKYLQNENINLDSEIVQKLKEMEKESVSLEVEIDRMKESKAELLEQIVEAERQILLWERKIQLEKEMQEKLNPNYGQADIEMIKNKIKQIDNQIRTNSSTGITNTELIKKKTQLEKDLQERLNLNSGNSGIEQLKKKIHMLELDLNTVKREQDKNILEMERIIYKKESIQLKYTNTKKNQKEAGNNSTQISKDIQALKTAIAESSKGLKEMDNNLRTKENELKNIRIQIDTSNEKINSYDYELDRTLAQITEKKVERLVSVNNIAAVQKYTKALEEVNTAGLKPPTENQKKQLSSLVDENSRLKDALLKLVESDPKYSTILTSVSNLVIN